MTQDPVRSGTWEGEDYAEHSGHHRAFDDWFLERLRLEPDDVLVDVGCGRGEFAARLASLVPDGYVVGVDKDPPMIEQARRQVDGNHLRFIQAPAQRIDTVAEHGSADMAVSRAVLRWLPLSQYRRVFEAVLRGRDGCAGRCPTARSSRRSRRSQCYIHLRLMSISARRPGGR